jgi:hypothetical protein
VAVPLGGPAMPHTFRTRTPLEALVGERALLLARQVQKAADTAPDGTALAAVEGPPSRPRPTRPKKGGAGPHLPEPPQARLAEAAGGPQRPDGRRGGPPRPPGPRPPRCEAGRHPLGARPGGTGLVSPPAQRLPCPAGASWSFDRARAWVEGRRGALLRSGASGLLAEMAGAAWAAWRGHFEPHPGRTGYAARLAAGRSIGSGSVEGSRVERMATLCAVPASDQWDAYRASKA